MRRAKSDNLNMRITELEQRIAALPGGSIATKRIRGRVYYYHRVNVDGKRVERYIPAAEVETLRAQIAERRELQNELRELQRNMPPAGTPTTTGSVSRTRRATSATRTPTAVGNGHDLVDSYWGLDDRMNPALVAETIPNGYELNIRTGASLRTFAAPVQGLARRDCYQQLHDYVYGPAQDKVLILYGLRRTGKTTLIRQLLAEMSDEELEATAFLQLTARNTLAEVNRTLRYLESRGYHTVFLDEVTLMEDFIQGAALFSDVFAACGMRLILSGTDSLGFLFTQDEQLYDRCILVHTTFIPYREFESVLGVHGIDEYIRYGGTMSLGGVHYNETSTFATKERADEYVDTAIARNIQHSLRCYQYEGHFRSLQSLYEANELTSAINRVVEDLNHRFTLEVLTRDFRSHDLTLSARNLRQDRSHPTDILDRIDVPSVTARLRELLEIRNRMEQNVTVSEAAGSEIREYLHLLDLVQDMDVVSMASLNERGERTVIAQPGLRYAQADALITSLLLDETMAELSLAERNAVCERIRNEIRGRMMEDIILLETRIAYPDKEVFVLQFPIGEFDMVVFDPAAARCRIYEIKHSDQVVPEQYRHLIDPDKCAQTEHRYGEIEKRVVLYRGKSCEVENIHYINIEEYLCGLSR